MSLVMMVVLILVMVSVKRRIGCAPWPRHYLRHAHMHRHFPPPFERDSSVPRVPAEPPVKRESAFELLKKRYVAGQLSDEQYERELDALLHTPEGRAQIQ